MARLRRTSDASTWILPAQCLIGRSHVCYVRPIDPKVSGEHALLRWRSGTWELQDLHSRNDTYVDGHAVGSGRKVRIDEGARLGFGRRDDEYVLVDAGPPEPHAVHLDATYTTAEAHDGFVVLPSAEAPEVTILHRDQGWWLESQDGLAPLHDGKILNAYGGPWRLHLPEQIPPTSDAKDVPMTLATITLRFVTAVDDGRLVSLVVQRGERRIPLEARAHHAPLFWLARARLAQSALPLDEQGWVQQEQLLAELGYDVGRLHVEIHRVRRQIAKAGVVDAVNVIERRQGARTLRVGVAALELVTV